jgi:hypothetical protein
MNMKCISIFIYVFLFLNKLDLTFSLVVKLRTYNFNSINDTATTNYTIPITNNVTVCEFQCEKLSMIFGCYCDLACLNYNDCCEMYSEECKYYFDQLGKDSFVLPTLQSQIVARDSKGSCCNSNQPPVNCFCDSRCEYAGDCCLDYKKCNIVVKQIVNNSTIKKTKKKKSSN